MNFRGSEKKIALASGADLYPNRESLTGERMRLSRYVLQLVQLKRVRDKRERDTMGFDNEAVSNLRARHKSVPRKVFSHSPRGWIAAVVRGNFFFYFISLPVACTP